MIASALSQRNQPYGRYAPLHLQHILMTRAADGYPNVDFADGYNAAPQRLTVRDIQQYRVLNELAKTRLILPKDYFTNLKYARGMRVDLKRKDYQPTAVWYPVTAKNDKETPKKTTPNPNANAVAAPKAPGAKGGRAVAKAFGQATEILTCCFGRDPPDPKHGDYWRARFAELEL